MASSKNPKHLRQAAHIDLRLGADVYELIKTIAQTETHLRGQHVAAQELIRMACDYVFMDNERMREAFRRSRWANTWSGQRRS